MNIVLPVRELQKRGSSGQMMLRIIADTTVAWSNRATATEYVIGFHGGAPTGSYNEWRFRTAAAWLRASYYERWFGVPGSGNEWYLDRAYLHLYRVSPLREEAEFLALHCDPNEPDDAPHAKYKRGPHLHVKVAENPFPKSHIALNLCDITTVLGSVDALSNALCSALTLIRERIIDLYLSEAA